MIPKKRKHDIDSNKILENLANLQTGFEPLASCLFGRNQFQGINHQISPHIGATWCLVSYEAEIYQQIVVVGIRLLIARLFASIVTNLAMEGSLWGTY